jgi:hypothetical protein
MHTLFSESLGPGYGGALFVVTVFVARLLLMLGRERLARSALKSRSCRVRCRRRFPEQLRCSDIIDMLYCNIAVPRCVLDDDDVLAETDT